MFEDIQGAVVANVLMQCAYLDPKMIAEERHQRRINLSYKWNKITGWAYRLRLDESYGIGPKVYSRVLLDIAYIS